MNSVDFNALAAAGRGAAELLEQKLEAAYLAAYRDAGRAAAKAFRARAEPVTAAADPEHGWSKPEPAELSNDATVAAALEAKTRATRKRMLQAIAAELVGVDFDVTSPYAQTLLDRLRFQENRAVEIREVVADAVDEGYNTGLSVPDTAKLIREKVFDLAPHRAKTLARTDLNGVSNGANLLAAKAAGVGGFKRWLTAEDDRVREMHVEADGQTVGIDEPFQVCDTHMQYPGDPDGPDACVFNCRCSLAFVDSVDAVLVSNVPEPIVAAAGPDVAELAMVAVYPTPSEQSAIAVDGGQDPEKLHTTMVFLGEVANIDLEAAARAVARVAGETEAMSGRVGGVGMFAAGPDGYPQLAIPNVGGLAELRHSLMAALADEGVDSPSEHDWVPHMTLQYVEEPALPDLAVIGLPLTYASVALVVADERTDYDFTGGTMRNEPTTASAVTITVDQPTDDAAPTDVALQWVSDIAFEGTSTDDGRYILPGALSWRTPPLTLMALIETGPGGHEGAEAAGRMDDFLKDDQFDMDGAALADGVVAVRATGVFDSGEYGVEIARMVDERTVRGVSVDLAILDWCFRDPATGELLDPADMSEADWERAFFGELDYAIREASIMAATVCPTPAFADARIARTASGEIGPAKLWAPIRIVTVQPEPRTASAAGKVPSRPPAGWFEIAETDFACPLTVEDDGRVYGHLALWETCHVGLAGCERPDPSPSEYAYIHTGQLETDEGVRISVGKIMLGGTHAQVRDAAGRIVPAAEASKHYDDNTFVGALVRAHDGRFGIWVSGTLHPDLPEDRIRDFMANPPSGDWRPINGALELIAGLAVPVPGYPVPRVAGADEEPEPVIAFGLDPAEFEEHVADRQIRVLAARAEGDIDGLAELALAETAAV